MTRRLACGVVALLCVPGALWGQASADSQAETLTKIFRFDPQLGDLSGIEVLFVHPDGAFDAHRDTIIGLARAFAGQRISSRGIAASELATGLSPSSVVYVLPEAVSPTVLSDVANAGSLSVSGSAAMAERGEVAIGLGRERQGRVEIVVNSAVLSSQGHELAPQMLKLARIVGTTGGSQARPQRVSEYSVGDDGVTAPRLLGFERPPYPPLARRLGVEGTVVLRVLVDPTGRVVEVELQEGIPQDVGINEAALNAGWSARFQAGTLDDRPVSVWTTIDVPFDL